MQHLDEGTVHAWLDGELSETEAAAAAQHVAECAQCAALVAEARGLIAGASRVVAALDAGPAGVIPRARQGHERGFWRRLTHSPSRMAMAATILVAVGVTLTVRRTPHESTTPRPAIGETPAAVSSPAIPPVNAAGAPASPAQSSIVAAELKDRAASTASNKSSAGAAPKPAAADEPTVRGGVRKQSASTVGGTADNALADKKKEADRRRDQPAPAAPASDLERAKAPSAAIAAPMVRQLQAVTSASPTRESAAQSQSARGAAADAISEVSLQGCYRLAVDTSAWRGVLPASFVLAGPSSRVQGAVGGQGAAPQATPASTNAVQRFAQKPDLAGFGVHAIGATGQADSTPIGSWTTVGSTTASVRFLSGNQPRLVTVVISMGSPVARVTTGDRTDSLHVTRIGCPR